MVEEGSSAPQPPPAVPPVVPTVPPVILPVPPAQPIVPPIQPIQQVPMPQLNWSHFKPEFTGKSDEDAKAQLLRTNYWMDTNAFPEGVKFQQFCLTSVGEARLWYDSLRPLALDWNDLQNQFGQQYSKIGNTSDSYFKCGDHST